MFNYNLKNNICTKNNASSYKSCSQAAVPFFLGRKIDKCLHILCTLFASFSQIEKKASSGRLHILVKQKLLLKCKVMRCMVQQFFDIFSAQSTTFLTTIANQSLCSNLFICIREFFSRRACIYIFAFTCRYIYLPIRL